MKKSLLFAYHAEQTLIECPVDGLELHSLNIMLSQAPVFVGQPLPRMVVIDTSKSGFIALAPRGYTPAGVIDYAVMRIEVNSEEHAVYYRIASLMIGSYCDLKLDGEYPSLEQFSLIADHIGGESLDKKKERNTTYSLGQDEDLAHYWSEVKH